MSWKTLSVSYIIANLFHLTGLLFLITSFLSLFLSLSLTLSLCESLSHFSSSLPNGLTDFNFSVHITHRIVVCLKCKRIVATVPLIEQENEAKLYICVDSFWSQSPAKIAVHKITECNIYQM